MWPSGRARIETVRSVRRMIAHVVDSITARPRLLGYLVSVTCPYCGAIHRHQWRRSDPDPGFKSPPCRPRNAGQYYVTAPQWLRERADEQVDRARRALDGLDLASVTDPSMRRAILVSAAALADAIIEATGGPS